MTIKSKLNELLKKERVQTNTNEIEKEANINIQRSESQPNMIETKPRSDPESSAQLKFIEDLGKYLIQVTVAFRLQNELKRYQEKYSPLEPVETDQKVIKLKFKRDINDGILERFGPLLKAYDERVIDLERHNEKLTNENNALLKSTQYQSPVEGLDRLADLQERIQVLSLENDKLLIEKKQLHDELKSTKNNVHFNGNRNDDLERQLKNAEIALEEIFDWKHEAEKVIAAKNVETSNLVEQLDQMKHKIVSLTSQLDSERFKRQEAKQTADELTVAYQNSFNDLKIYVDREAGLLDEIKLLQEQIGERSSHLADLNREVEVLQTENESILEILLQYEAQLEEIDNEELQKFQEIENLRQEMQDNKIEKEKNILEVEAAKNEVKRFEERLHQTLKRHESQIENERIEIKNHFAGERKKLIEEINDMSVKKAEAESTRDKAVREKRTLESELESLKQKYFSEIKRLQESQKELQEKMSLLSRERDDAVYRLELFQENFVKESNRFENEKKSLTSEIDNLSKRLSKAEYESEEAKEEKLKIYKDNLSLKEENSNIKKLYDETKKNFASELQKLDSSHKNEVDDLKNQISSISALHEKKKIEVQELIQNQENLALKWKDESNQSRKQYETTIAELEKKLKESSEIQQGLKVQLSKMQINRKDLQQQLKHAKKSHGALQVLVNEAESKANYSTSQVKILLQREHDLIQQVKLLQKANDRLIVEKTHSKKDLKLLDELDESNSTAAFYKQILETKLALRNYEKCDSSSVSEVSSLVGKENEGIN